MNRNRFIAARLREVLLNGRWIANTNYKEQIENIDWQQATKRIHDLNSIAALTFHINYYLEGLMNAFTTGQLTISDKFSFDMPPVNSIDDWTKLVQNFIKNSENFVNYVEQLEDRRLDEPFVDDKYGTLLRNIEGVIEHCYYHLGQISLIRKMTGEH